MYSDFRSFNPEGERLLVLTLAGKLSGELQDCPDQDAPGLLRKIMSGLRPARSQPPVAVAETSAACDDHLSGAVPMAR